MKRDSYLDTWDFIVEYLQNYSSRDDVLRDDILVRYVDPSEEVCEEDLEWIEEEFHGDMEEVKEEIMALETGFFEEALREYYGISR